MYMYMGSKRCGPYHALKLGFIKVMFFSNKHVYDDQNNILNLVVVQVIQLN